MVKIKIRRTKSASPQGSEVYVDGVKMPGVYSVDWKIEANDADLVTLTFKADVEVEHFEADSSKKAVVETTNLGSTGYAHHSV